MNNGVLIVGGGPAGLVAALALTRRGIPVEIVEIEQSFTAVGVGVNLQNSPLRALNTLGLIDEIVAAGYPTGIVNMLAADGTPLMPALQPPSLIPGGPSSIGIGRGVLASILAGHVRASAIPTRFGATVTALDDDGNRVRATFSDGSVGEYGLVVGADGVNSSVRTLLLGAGARQPQFSGQAIWRAGAARGDIDEYQLYNGPISKVGLVPISTDRMYVYVVEMFAGEPHRDDFPDPDAAMRQAMAPFGGAVPGVAQRLDTGADLRALKVLLVDDPWYRGRVVLIGDAAHATTPHISYGLGIAVEDGIVLAELAEAHGDDVASMLSEFMHRRFERARLVVENSAQLGQWEQHPPEDRTLYPALMGHSLAALSHEI
jgi:2-polyprenyl-6-methoxyphenol hydroxylase-like FAD-dependent oxidoreductase